MPSGEPAVRPVSKRRGEAGYNLVILVVAITVMGIMLAVALPSWSSVIRRDREEELIFRGFQYAEAIRCFNRRYHRYPVKLAELMETSPRSIRQLWKDPMTEDGKWRLLFQGGPGTPLRPQVEGGQQQGVIDTTGANPAGTTAPGDSGKTGAAANGSSGPTAQQPGSPGSDDPNGGQPGQDGSGKQEIDPTGPIIGVASRSSKESFLIFNGRQRYDEWEFTVDILNGSINNRGVGVKTGAAQLNVRWIGRPIPQDLLAPGMGQPGAIPGGVGIPGGTNGLPAGSGTTGTAGSGSTPATPTNPTMSQ